MERGRSEEEAHEGKSEKERKVKNKTLKLTREEALAPYEDDKDVESNSDNDMYEREMEF